MEPSTNPPPTEARKIHSFSLGGTSAERGVLPCDRVSFVADRVSFGDDCSARCATAPITPSVHHRRLPRDGAHRRWGGHLELSVQDADVHADHRYMPSPLTRLVLSTVGSAAAYSLSVCAAPGQGTLPYDTTSHMRVPLTDDSY
eukprot:4299442-Pyramimonas_sp.AAC.2